jgi:MFS family permease
MRAVTDRSPTLWSDDEQRLGFRRNYVALTLDGAFYTIAIAFVAAETVLPNLLTDLGGPTWLVAMAPTLGVYGFYIVPLFTAHRVEKLRNFSRFVAWVGVPQRLPALVAGLALLFFGAAHPRAVMWTVAASAAAIGLFGGALVSAFWEMIAKIVPPHRRSSNLAVRSVAGASFGLAAGGVVEVVLARWPGPEGYGMLYLLCFFFMMLSLGALFSVRELPHVPHPRAGEQGWSESLRLLPQWLKADPFMRRFLVARVCAAGLGVLTPFLAVHARSVLHAEPSFLGRLVIAQMAGTVAGNLFAAYVGDRRGGRIVAIVGGFLALSVCVGAIVNRTEAGFLAMFFALGATTLMSINGAMTLLLELFPAERRPTFVSLVAFATVPALLGASALAWLSRTLSHAVWPAALVAGAFLVTSQINLFRLPEPRKAAALR